MGDTLLLAAFAFGLILGSFLNVCIFRLPYEESIVKPRSHCRGCGAQISWYDNIPLFSYLWLKGACRYCHESIPLQYPLVEAVTGVLSAGTLYKFGYSTSYLLYFLLLVAPLIVIAFIDLGHRIIPNVISIPGIGAGILTTSLLGPGLHPVDRLLFSLIGIATGGGALFLVSWLYEKLRGQEGIGMGDVKLAAMFGAFFGWKGVFVILMLSSLLGSLVGIFLMVVLKKGLKYAVPFGPFLAGGALIYLFYGNALLSWYLGYATHVHN